MYVTAATVSGELRMTCSLLVLDRRRRRTTAASGRPCWSRSPATSRCRPGALRLALISAPPRRRSSQVFGPSGSPTSVPHALAVVARVGHPAGAVGVVLVRRRVQAAAPAQLDLLAEALLGLLADVGEVDDARLELRQRADELDRGRGPERGRDLGLQPGGDRRDLDVVDGHLDADLAAPVLGEAIEPLVVARHEVAPDEDLQLAGELLRRVGELLRRARRRLPRSCPLSSSPSDPPQPTSTIVAAVPWMNLRRVITNGLPRSVIVALPCHRRCNSPTVARRTRRVYPAGGPRNLDLAARWPSRRRAPRESTAAPCRALRRGRATPPSCASSCASARACSSSARSGTCA